MSKKSKKRKDIQPSDSEKLVPIYEVDENGNKTEIGEVPAAGAASFVDNFGFGEDSEWSFDRSSTKETMDALMTSVLGEADLSITVGRYSPPPSPGENMHEVTIARPASNDDKNLWFSWLLICDRIGNSRKPPAFGTEMHRDELIGISRDLELPDFVVVELALLRELTLLHPKVFRYRWRDARHPAGSPWKMSHVVDGEPSPYLSAENYTGWSHPANVDALNDAVKTGLVSKEEEPEALKGVYAKVQEKEDDPKWVDSPTLISPSGAVKVEPKLACYGLIPVGPLEEVAKHYGRALQKYPERNWEAGHPWRVLYDAAHRHMAAFWSGEDIDRVEDGGIGSPHLAAAIWSLLGLLEYSVTHPELDDRPKRKD